MKTTRKFSLGVAITSIGSSLVAVIFFMSCAGSERFYTDAMRVDTYTQSYAIHGYDFLWVLDNSASMAPKRTYIADNIQTFLSILNSRKAIDYQMAVTNVDYFSTPGALIANTDGLNVVKSVSSVDPAADFASIVTNDGPTGTAFWEQGLIQAYTAIQNHGSLFLRDGIPLVVIVVSDDDDWSCQGMLSGGSSCFGVQAENNPDVNLYDSGFFINFFKTLKASQNTDVTVFPVIGKSDATCTIERIGMRYQEVARQVGGVTVTGGLCPDVIGTSLNNIAQTIANRGLQFQLTQPSDGTDLTVYVNSQVIPYSSTNGYTFDATTNSIFFSGDAIPGNGDSVQILYGPPQT